MANVLPVLPLRDIVVFPHMVAPLFVGRDKSVRALEEVRKAAARSCSSPRRKPASTTRPRKTSIPSAWSPRSCSC